MGRSKVYLRSVVVKRVLRGGKQCLCMRRGGEVARVNDATSDDLRCDPHLGARRRPPTLTSSHLCGQRYPLRRYRCTGKGSQRRECRPGQGALPVRYVRDSSTACWSVLTAPPVHCQARAKQTREEGHMQRALPDFPITVAARNDVITCLLEELRSRYVVPETAEQIAEAVHGRLARGEYDTITSSATFCETLTAQMQEISRDQHLRLVCSAEPLPPRDHAEASPEWRTQYQ